MSKLLTLTDGTQYHITDDSSYTRMKMRVDFFGAVDLIAPKFVIENMLHITIDEDVFENIIPMSLTAVKDDNKVLVTIENRDMSFEEKTAMQISEIQDALIEIVSGGDETEESE